ncbi:MAG: DUF4412 domain-containing protein [Opitutaceae bacterium]|nr:DUF4412 domain-containing protein [Opitutaceae bacterium]
MNLLLRVLAVAGLFTASQLFAAKAFEGKVSLAITAEKGRTQALDYSIKGQRLRMDMTAEKKQVATIMDLQKMEMLMLMPEEKMYMVMPIKQMVDKAAKHADKEIDKDVDVQRTGRTEKILGYECAEILVKDKAVTTEMWVAEDLGMFMGLGENAGGGGGMFGGGRKSAASAKWEEALKGKGGFPLRVISRDPKGKETFKMEATKIEPGSLPESQFTPPAGWQKFQMPDLGGLFKKN